jgi:NTF2 fold immunity protein
VADVPESTEIHFSTALLGPLLNGEDIARRFAMLILGRLYGEAELAKQQPLRVTDQGTDWVITGSHQEPGKLPGTGAWFIQVRKSDCRVEKFGHYAPLEISDEVKSILASAKRAT